MSSTQIITREETLSAKATKLWSRPPSEKLAIYGGPRAITMKFRERWRRVRIRDIAPAIPYLVVGTNTTTQGMILNKFEARFAALTDSCFSIMMNSGTATLHSAYFAVGVRPGDEVIVPSYTFFASATPILQIGATPIFCDIDEKTLTADPDDVERRITSKTKAICIVHLWGNPARLDRFVEIARKYEIALIEDASHAHGASYQGRPVGSFGDIGCFSLQGSKAVSGGEAGIAVTNNARYYDRMLALGHCYRQSDFVTDELNLDGMSMGMKYRPHLFAIALAGSSLSRLGKLNELRRRNYAILAEELADCEAVQTIETNPGGIRGGMLEFILRYRAEKVGGLRRDSFCAAVQAEGALISPDRYTLQSTNGRVLHEVPLFNEFTASEEAGPMSMIKYDQLPREENLTASAKISDQLLTLPAFTKVDENYVRQTAKALKKVASAVPHIKDYRTGEY